MSLITFQLTNTASWPYNYTESNRILSTGIRCGIKM